MRKNNKRPTSYKARPKRKTKKNGTPKRKPKSDEPMLITIKNYDKYKPLIDEMKRRGITPENFRERTDDIKELVPLIERCMKGGE